MAKGRVDSWNVWAELTAGGTAGIASTLVAHPLDVLRVRSQLNIQPVRQSWSQVSSAALRNLKNVHKVQAAYRGLTPNLIGNSSSWALFFLFYSGLKEGIKKWHNGERSTLSSIEYLLLSSTAGLATAVLTNPIWVIKTRMLSTPASHPNAYRSMREGALRIQTREGFGGFYRGFYPSLVGIAQGAIQIAIYEKLKSKASESSTRSLNASDFVMLSGIAKMLSTGITYPYQVIRSRLQMYEASTRYSGIKDVVVKTWYGEGLAGFYKGLGLTLLRVVPSTCITFAVYETLKQRICR